MPVYLAQIALGPVQGFISAAREMRDFAFGSQLLSYFANQTAVHLKAKHAQLIFPADTGLVNTNKIMVMFEDHTQSAVEQIMKEVEQQVRQELLDTATKFFSAYAPDELNTHDAAIWQVCDVLEYYWAISEITEQGYATAVRTVDRLMAARKMTRDYVANKYASTQLKSSLTGTYESVIPSRCYVQQHDDGATRRQKLANLHDRYGIDRAEHLSGVDLFKRRYHLPGVSAQYVSPRAMAARSCVMGMDESQFAAFDAQWRQDEDNTGGVSFWHDTPDRQSLLISEDAEDRFDVQTWYVQQADRLQMSDEFINDWTEVDAMIRQVSRDQGQSFTDSSFKYAIFREGLRNYLAEVDRDDAFIEIYEVIETLIDLYGIELPKLPRRTRFQAMLKSVKRSESPYYVMMRADGDNMGDYVATLASQGYVVHQQLSRAVAEFAAGVPTIVNKYHGYCVYVGGDDLLVMVPLRQAVKCARELNDTFVQALEPIHALAPTLSAPALSVGCVMVHHAESLDEVMQILDKTEKYAKTQKSALAICVAKRSGGALTVAGRWMHRINVQEYRFDELMDSIMQMSISRQIPYGYAYEIRQMLSRMNGNMPQLNRVIRLEAQRILKRKKQAENYSVNVGDINRLIDNTRVFDGDTSDFSRLNQWVSQIIVAQNLSV